MTEAYRSRARQVREAARARLRALRQERRAEVAGRAGAAPAAPLPAPPREPAAMRIEVSPSARRVSDAAAVPEAATRVCSEVEPPSGGGARPAGDGPRAGGAPTAEAAPPSLEIGASPAPDADRPGSGSGTAVSDLAELPGAGPGLVWLLERAGIGCRAELAEAEPAALRAALGPVGDLLDLDGWIRAAREEARASAGDPPA